MTPSSTVSPSQFVWFEYVTGDAPRAQGFFGELFHWKSPSLPMPDGTYDMIALGNSGATIGGYRTGQGAQAAHWLAFLRVADARASADQVVALGGRLVSGPTRVADRGIKAIVTDPHGAALALWQPLAADAKPPVQGVGAFAWNELSSRDPAASVAFYRAIGNLDASSMEMPDVGTYHVLAGGETPGAGIVGTAPEQPHAWLPYVEVASTDETTARAGRLGATILVPPTDVPQVGRFAIIVDPQGAQLGLLQPPAA